MREQDIICTVCPMGCTIHVTGTDTEIQSVTGFTCPRGEKYARSEFTCPVRTLTTTVRIFRATEPLLPVRVDRPIPKEKLFECMEAIRKLRTAEKLEELPEKMKETVRLREEYPELTLAELAQEFDPPVTKSCLNHRLRKLLELARALEKKEEGPQNGPL